ncbi:MAG: single-strand binding protein [Eubacterium sp.]|nr:single-strand binding protein [Eubacterium sp.]
MNKVVLMGRLTKHPELRYTRVNNAAVACFPIAVDRRGTSKDGKPQADFFNIIAWNKTAEFCQKYLTKGMKVAIVGRLQTRKWEDNEGNIHYVTEVVADETYFADSKRETSRDCKPNAYEQQYDGDGFYPMAEDDELPF